MEEIGHPQPPTPIHIDNSTALGVVIDNIQPTHTKEMYMSFHWLRDRDTHKQLILYWCPGTTNRGACWTKHHCVEYHQTIRLDIMTPRCQLDSLRASFQETHQFLGLVRGCARYGHLGCGNTTALSVI